MWNKKTTEQFIKEVKEVHGDRYDYSKLEYTNNKSKVLIICREHGESYVGAIEHLKGANCYKCGKEAMASKCRKTKETFIQESVEKHSNKYDYSKVEYKNNRTKVVITCPIHGGFEKTPDKHLAGSGCRKCEIERRTLSNNDFIERCTIIHSGKYNYDNVEYVHSNSYVNIICPLHGEYKQKAKNHLIGHGCKKCCEENNYFRRSHYIKLAKKANLYILRCWNDEEEFYKIGRTVSKITKRYAGKSLPYSYELIYNKNYDIEVIYDLELEIHKEYKDFKYKPNIDFFGRTECYVLTTPIDKIIENNERLCK